MTVYYLCPDIKSPVGGIRVIYRHVDILNKYGTQAYVVHATRGFRAEWFNNETPIVYWRNNLYQRLAGKLARRLDADRSIELLISGGSSKKIGLADILVIPEMYGPDLAGANGRGIPKVILNQNCYLTFRGYSFQRDRRITPYRHRDVLATLINSVDGQEYLRFAFPDLPTHRFRLSIDSSLFRYQPEKKRQICFSRIKNESDAMQVVNILKFRGALKDFDIVPFINVPQREMARLCRESAIFLSFGYPEGFGLPPAEAMACGCVVVGFHGGGGREFFRPEFSYPIEQGDIVGFARAVEEVIEGFDSQPEQMQAKGRAAAEFIRNTYSAELEEQEVVSAWRDIVARHELKAQAEKLQ